MQIWDSEEMEMVSEITESNLKEVRKQKFLRQPKRPTKVLCVPPVNRIFTFVESEWIA